MDRNIVYALGFFDGVHLGHQALLTACRELAGATGARPGVVTFLGHPETLVKGEAPKLLNTPQDRQRLLRSFGMEEIVELPFDEKLMHLPWQAFLGLLKEEYAAAGLVCGHDFHFGSRGAGDAAALEAWCREKGMACQVVSRQTLEGVTVSSTHIRGLLEQGALEAANRFLGHPHLLTGTVVPGRRIGRTIGIPTANLPIPEALAQLPRGVYACKAGEYLAVTNIGSRPTVGGHECRAESWLLDYTGDLYGQELTLAFYAFLRPERKFGSLEALKAQIQTDAAMTRQYFAQGGR